MWMTRRNFIIGTIGIIGLWNALFPTTGACYEPTPAELISNVYLRQHPDKNGNILMLLTRGEKLVIQDEIGPWAKVSHELQGKKGEKVTGWISKQYLKPVLSSVTAPPAASAAPVASPAPHPTPPVQPSAPAQTAQDISLATAASSIASSTEQAGEKRQPVVSEPLPAVHKSRTSPFSMDNITAYFKKSGQPSTAGPLTQESGYEKVSVYDAVVMLTRMLFKFSLLCISCMALLFSYSAIRVARSIHYQR